MPGCENPVWPCAMTGAADCLSGFHDVTVVIHGSSGCYYYPESLLRMHLSGTFLVEEEVVFGAEDRLREVVAGLSGKGKSVAVVTTCVPSLTGEDTARILGDYQALFVDSPGFAGPYEEGYKKALLVLDIRDDPDIPGINVDGLSRFDPFTPGNLAETARLLAMAGVPVAARMCRGTIASVSRSATRTITTNPDLASGTGYDAGDLLGIDHVRSTFRGLEASGVAPDVGAVLAEADAAEERLVKACDRYLRRHDPPAAAIFSWFPYARFAVDTLKRYLDAETVAIGSRTQIGPMPYPASHTIDLAVIEDLITENKPDLLVGSSFEHFLFPDIAFVPLTPPIRGRILLRATPVAGLEGILSFTETVLNACMDKYASRKGK